MKRKALSLLMAVAMLLSLVVIPAAADESETTAAGAPSYGDVSGHWAEGAINRWSGYGVVQGDTNGDFNPDADMTVAELATTLNNTMGYVETATNTFADLKGDEWYADAILKLAAAGILKGDGVNINATSPVDRERATVIMARALGIQPVANPDLSGFNDGASAADWSAGYIKAMADAGIIKGVGNGTLALTSEINRASVMTIMNNAVSDYITTGGPHEVSGTGIVIVKSKAEVTLTGTAGDILVAPGSASGSVTLDKVTVTGTVTMNAANAQLIAKDAVIANINVAAAGTGVDLQGKSSVKSVMIAASASDMKLTVAKDAVVDKVESAASGLTVSGEGTVKNAVITGGENVKVTTPGTAIDNKGTSDVTTDKGVVKPGESNGSTGGGGGSGGGSGGGDNGGSSTDDTYTVSYNGNGKDGGTDVVDSAKYKSGAKATAADNTYTRTGYTFLEWNTKADGTGTSYAAKAEITISGNVTLYAQWEADSSEVGQQTISTSNRIQVRVGDDTYYVNPASAYEIAGLTFANDTLTIDSTALTTVANSHDDSYHFEFNASDNTYHATTADDAYWTMYSSTSGWYESLIFVFTFTAPSTDAAMVSYQFSSKDFADAANNTSLVLNGNDHFTLGEVVYANDKIWFEDGDTLAFYVIWTDSAGNKTRCQVTIDITVTASTPTP